MVEAIKINNKMQTAPSTNSKRASIHAMETSPSTNKHDKSLTKESSRDGQLSNIECGSDFSFEKARIKAIEHTQLFASLNTGNVSHDSILGVSKVPDMNDLLDNSKQSKGKITCILQTMGTILSLFAILNLIAVLFAMLFLSVSNMPLTKYLFLLLIEIIFTTGFFIISLKSSTAEKLSLQTLSKYLKFIIVYSILLFSLMIILMLQQSINEALESACTLRSSNSHEDTTNAVYSIVLLSVFFSCFYKIIVMIVNIILCVLLKRLMVKIEELEQRTLDSKSYKLSI